jgi:hypothetical protein
VSVWAAKTAYMFLSTSSGTRPAPASHLALMHDRRQLPMNMLVVAHDHEPLEPYRRPLDCEWKVDANWTIAEDHPPRELVARVNQVAAHAGYKVSMRFRRLILTRRLLA